MKVKSACIQIYREAFGNDGADFTNELFNDCFKYLLYLEREGEILSMLFDMPCKIITELEEIKAGYLYAVATAEKHRSKGYMTELLNLAKQQNKVLFLRPANENLIKFYENHGFKTIKGISNNNGLPKVEPDGDFLKFALNNAEENNREFPLMYFSIEDIDIQKLHFIYSME